MHSQEFPQEQQKEKRGTKKRKSFKAETIKRLSPRSKCYCFSHSRASRIQKFFLTANHGGRYYFSVFHGPSTLRSISPALLSIYKYLHEKFFPQKQKVNAVFNHIFEHYSCIIDSFLILCKNKTKSSSATVEKCLKFFIIE